MHTSPAFCVNSFTAGNTYSLYHKDVAKHPRLSPEEEKTLPILASAGDAVNIIGVCLHPGASEHHNGDIRTDWPRCQFVPYQLPLVIRNA